MISRIERRLLGTGCEFLSGIGRWTKWYSRKSTCLCLQHILLFETVQRWTHTRQLGSLDATRQCHVLWLWSDSHSYPSRQSLDIDGRLMNLWSASSPCSRCSRRLIFVLVVSVITILWVARMTCVLSVSTRLSSICMQPNDRSVRCPKVGAFNQWIWSLNRRTEATAVCSHVNLASILHANGHWILLKHKCLTFVHKWSTKSTWNNFLFNANKCDPRQR